MEYFIYYDFDKVFINIKVKGKLTFQMAEKYPIEAIKIAHQDNML